MPTKNDLMLNSLVKGDFAKIYGSRTPEPNHDAFGRLRVSDPITIFDSQSQYNEQPLLWHTIKTGSADSIHLPNESSVNLVVTTADTDSCIRQTKEYFRYQPGKSQLVLTTFCFGEATANNSQKIGYFDDRNGIYLEYANNTLYICQRSYVSGTAQTTRIPQSEWNIDKLDGTTGTEITLNPRKSQIFLVDMEWLGVGRVRTGFVINGAILYAHEFLNANQNETVYMTTANLPVRYEITNTGTANATSLKAICCSVISEGGVEENRGFPVSEGNRDSTKAITTRTPLFSISPANTYLGQDNRTQSVLEDISMFIDSGTAFVEIVYNGVLTGAVWNLVSANVSTMRYDRNATAIANGITMSSFYISGTNQTKGTGFNEFKNKLPFTMGYSNTSNSDVISVVVTGIGGSATTACSVRWAEYR
jgi:hypothetical protein